MGENSNEFLPIVTLGNRYAVLIKIEFLEIPFNSEFENRERLPFKIIGFLIVDFYFY
jgi:hypothetical protein